MRVFEVRTLALWLASLAICSAKILTDLSVVNNTRYDFIIVGGGTAGNVLGSRLSENPSWNILVLEAGPSNDGVVAVEIPFYCTYATPKTPWDWNYTTVPQPGMGGRAPAYPRGHILGGSSSVNYLMWTRGSKSDWDRYAAVSGDQGWSWANMQYYFRKSETLSAPVDKHNTTGQVDPAVHGVNGPVSVTLPGWATSIDGPVFEAASQIGEPYKYLVDYNNGSPLGLGWMQYSANGSRRASSSTAYLTPTVLQRPNLHVLVGAEVSRILQTGKAKNTPSFKGVEYRVGSGALQTLTATTEVILSAGAIGTPRILLSSGIGPSSELTPLGINTIVDIADVGKNFSDHPFVSNGFIVNSTNTFDYLNRQATPQQQAVSAWQATGTGPLVNTIASQIGWFRLPSSNPIFQTVQDPSAGPTSGHHELLVSNGDIRSPPTGNFFALTTIVVSPSSRGSVTINSSDPFAAPLLDPALLSTEFDMVVLREAIKLAANYTTAPVWSGYVMGPSADLAATLNSTNVDAALNTYIAKYVNSIWHPVATASMSPPSASWGVVNPDLKVKKVAGLRVVDASIFPYVPSMHPQAAVYAMAERMSDVIKATYKK